MAGFSKSPILRVTLKGWQLVYRLSYYAVSGEKIVVPAGFDTDLASIPQLFQAVLSVNDRHRAAAILHDYLYTVQDRPREQADALFLEAMKLSGVRFTQRWAMYLAVRIGGWLPWSRK